MPFKTEYGTHYHIAEGCHGAFISCDTTGLEPCSDCCGKVAPAASSAPSSPVGDACPTTSADAANLDMDPLDGPARFSGDFTTPEASGVYAIRIARGVDGRAEAVSSKGRPVGRVGSGDEEERMERLASLLEMTSSADIAHGQPAPSDVSVTKDDVRSIYFDMDGTLADLYSVPDWLPKLRLGDPTPYEDATPLVDMGELDDAVRRLQKAGWHVGIVSWLAKTSDDRYNRAVSTSKRLWLLRHLPTVDEINFVSYGVAKHAAVANGRNAVLVDDEEQNLDAWRDDRLHRTVIDASDPKAMMRKVQRLAKSR